MIYLSKEDFEKLPIYQKSDLRLAQDGTLYKRIRDIDTRSSLDFLYYIKSLPPIEGLVQPIDLIKDTSIYGYQMPLINDAKSVAELIKTPDPDLDILEIIRIIFTILKRINEYLILGDVTNANILVKKLEAHFIDWDNGKRKNNPYPLSTLYCIHLNGQAINDSILTDNIKTFITCMSLYYEKNIERFMRGKSITTLLDILKNIQANENIIYYLEHLIE